VTALRARIAELTVVRHGQSTANAAFAAAEAGGPAGPELTGRDADVPLSPTGWAQAAQLGRWLAALPAQRRSQVVLCSPYLRARQTWSRMAAVAAELGVGTPAALLDERLRDRAMGELELMTAAMIAERFPAETTQRARAGEFRYRPPGGESFMDIAARLRTLLHDLDTGRAGERVLLVAHDAVVLMLRQLIEDLSLDELAVIAGEPVANASVTRFDGRTGRLRLAGYNVTAHLAA
jgi:probable phosphoglycerate mutase